MTEGGVERFVASGVPAPAGAYSHGAVAGGLIFTAGMGPNRPDGTIVEGGVADQTEQVLRNLEAVLTARGRGLTDVVKVTVHLAAVGRDFAAFDAAYRRVMPAPYPVRTTVGSTLAGILVEIDVVALA